MLRDFTLLNLFSERCAITSTITTGTADFLRAFGHDGAVIIAKGSRDGVVV